LFQNLVLQATGSSYFRIHSCILIYSIDMESHLHAL
jgi:hypothetical protein